jgi:hypothetical protein
MKMGLMKPIAICKSAGTWGKLTYHPHGFMFVEPAMDSQNIGSKMCICER